MFLNCANCTSCTGLNGLGDAIPGGDSDVLYTGTPDPGPDYWHTSQPGAPAMNEALLSNWPVMIVLAIGAVGLLTMLKED